MFKNLLLTLLALGYQTASATSLLETFGSGDDAFTMEFVPIGNAGNAADTTGSPSPAGSVAYTYNLGKYEVSRDMITKANSEGSLGITMYNMSSLGGNGVNRPATGVTWNDAAIYVNWLNTNQGYQAAYKFSGSTFELWSSTDVGYDANNLFRNSQAKYVIASSNEWYKAAYGNLDGTWNNYATGSDSAPTAVSSGTTTNTAVYSQSSSAGPADITTAGGLSPWGTVGQGGNVWEWTESAYSGGDGNADLEREFRGGAWEDNNDEISASFRYKQDPTVGTGDIGFRVASVPEPSALSLLAIGLSGLALVRRRKQS